MTGAPPLTSVVIPAYNEESYLAEAIESVLAQTYEPVEVIVVDDGSTDASAEIASSYPQVILHRQPNAGLAAARNAGFELTTGAFVTFHDADDMMAPQKIEAQVSHLDSHPDAGLVLTHQRLLIEEGAELPFWLRDERVPGSPGVGPPPAALDAPHTMTMLMRREVFLEVGVFDEQLRVAQDLDWLFRAFEEKIGVETLEEKLLIRRIHPSSLTQDESSSRRELFETFHKRIERRRRRAADGASP